MTRLIRVLIMAFGFMAVLYLIRKVFRSAGPPMGNARDASKEVKNASYKAEDVEDAEFKDTK